MNEREICRFPDILELLEVESNRHPPKSSKLVVKNKTDFIYELRYRAFVSLTIFLALPKETTNDLEHSRSKVPCFLKFHFPDPEFGVPLAHFLEAQFFVKRSSGSIFKPGFDHE